MSLAAPSTVMLALLGLAGRKIGVVVCGSIIDIDAFAGHIRLASQ